MNKGRLLAIDYGKRRTGIAVSDPLQIIAQGLATVPTGELLNYLESYMKAEPVERVVVGRPLQTTGEESENAARADEFIRAFKKRFPAVPVDTADERFTSVLAHDAMLQSGIGRQKRRDKALVDRISATIILQSYMESRRMAHNK